MPCKLFSGGPIENSKFQWTQHKILDLAMISRDMVAQSNMAVKDILKCEWIDIPIESTFPEAFCACKTACFLTTKSFTLCAVRLIKEFTLTVVFQRSLVNLKCGTPLS